MLADGMMSTSAVKVLSTERDISKNTLERTADEFGVVNFCATGAEHGGSEWSLPGSKYPNPSQTGAGKLGRVALQRPNHHSLGSICGETPAVSMFLTPLPEEAGNMETPTKAHAERPRPTPAGAPPTLGRQ